MQTKILIQSLPSVFCSYTPYMYTCHYMEFRPLFGDILFFL